MDPDPERVLREWFTPNIWNVTGYSNPRVDELIEKIKIDVVTYARDAYFEEVWKIVTADLVYLPIRRGVSAFALSENLRDSARPLERAPVSPRAAQGAEGQLNKAAPIPGGVGGPQTWLSRGR